jgi:asparagine synthase (glutamine-hydrolysing)
VVALMAELAGADRVKTFSIGFSDPRFDETAHARSVAAHLGTEHHEQRLAPGTMLDVLPDVADFLDEPLGDASLIPAYLLCRFARGDVTVALSGDGGDELFEGYPTFAASGVADLYFGAMPAPLRAVVERAARWLPARDGYFSLDFAIRQFLRGGATPGPVRHQRWLASFLPEELDALLLPDARRAAGGDPLAEVVARAALTSARDPRDRLMDFYSRFYLAGDVNTKVDRASGAVGLEVRSPLLDTDVVTFACQLPPSLRRRGLVSKYVLKQAMRGHLPGAILARRKQGFAVPVARWLRGELASVVRDELAADKLRREGFFDPAVVGKLIDEHMSGRRDWRKPLWTLFMFERWLARWGA